MGRKSTQREIARRDVKQVGTNATPAALARKTLKMSIDDAAKRARICPEYLRRIEQHGGAPYILALRLSSLYGCPITLFLYAQMGDGTPKLHAHCRRRNRR